MRACRTASMQPPAVAQTENQGDPDKQREGGKRVRTETKATTMHDATHRISWLDSA